jgi:hypothetical protein
VIAAASEQLAKNLFRYKNKVAQHQREGSRASTCGIFAQRGNFTFVVKVGELSIATVAE